MDPILCIDCDSFILNTGDDTPGCAAGCKDFMQRLTAGAGMVTECPEARAK
jgi:hypothetical protein